MATVLISHAELYSSLSVLGHISPDNRILWDFMSFWHLFWSKKTSKFDGNVMTFWWNSTGFLWGKGIPVKCHENVTKFQCHSMRLKILVHCDGIFMENVHGIVMEFDVIFDQNSDGNQWWHFIMRDSTTKMKSQ